MLRRKVELPVPTLANDASHQRSLSPPPVVRKNKSRPLSGLLHQAVFVVQATEHRRLRNAETRWQLVSMAAGRNFVLGGFR